MKVLVGQINTVVGDFEGNVRKVIAACEHAWRDGADLALFPELTLTGYPPMDLLERSSFIEANLRALDAVRGRTAGHRAPVIVGFAQPNPEPYGKPLFNAAAVLRDGHVAGIHRKVLLPTYDVFDEARYFEPGPAPAPIEVDGARIAVTICEDIWNDKAVWSRTPYHEDPIRSLMTHPPTSAGPRVGASADVVVNLSASPFVVGKLATRLELAGGIARRHGVPVVYGNLVGGNDGLIFDGESFVVSRDGDVVFTAAAFREDTTVIEIADRKSQVKSNATGGGGAGPVTATTAGMGPARAVMEALCLGIRDFCGKLGIPGVLVGLSGGIDSAVTTCLAVRALGPDAVCGVTMPSRFTSASALEGARELARNLGIRLEEVPIDPVVDALVSALRPALGELPWGVTEENLQARVRGTLLMAFSNRTGALVLNTGNKSELAVGYCTLYGDMVGGLAVIGDLSKQTVYEVAREVNRERRVIPEDTLARPPSAELRPGQRDEDSLPPYPALDPIVRGYVEDGLDARDLVRAGHDGRVVDWVLGEIARAEFKRRQAPLALKVTSRAFGVGRRFPVVQRFRDDRLESGGDS